MRSPQDKARVERAVPGVRDDCFAGEQLQSLEDARRHARAWCLEDYGMRRHSTTYRPPLEHFEAEEKAHLLPAPTERYDVPLWCNPKVGRDPHAQVDRALYSLPECYKGKVLRARADRSTVRFYDGNVLIKTHARVLPGRRSTDISDFPQEKTAYGMGDIDFLKGQAEKCGTHTGQLAAILLDDPLPWTRMRRVYALLSLVRKYGEKRVDDACAVALGFEMHEAQPIRARLEEPTARMFERIGPEFGFAQRVVFANLWLTRPLVLQKLEESPTTNAMIRTTATTIFQTGTKDNVLPSRAPAVANLSRESCMAVTVNYRRFGKWE